MVKGLGTVIYQVADLDRAKAWYAQAFQQQPYFDQPFYVGFDVAGYELGLLPDADPADGAITYWGVADVAAAVAVAVAAGSTVHVAPSDVGEGIITASVRTPTGSILGLIYNPHFKSS